MRRCETAIDDWSASTQEALWAVGCRCPGCAARGVSVLADDAGRFTSCLVCGLTAQPNQKTAQ